MCQQGLQFSYVLLGNVLLFRVVEALTPNNNTVCTLLLDCGKQQLGSFSLSLHNMWFLRIDCIPMIPVIWLRSWKIPRYLLSPCMAVTLTFLVKLSFCFVPFWICPLFDVEWEDVLSGVRMLVHHRFMQWLNKVFCLVLSCFLNNYSIFFITNLMVLGKLPQVLHDLFYELWTIIISANLFCYSLHDHFPHTSIHSY